MDLLSKFVRPCYWRSRRGGLPVSACYGRLARKAGGVPTRPTGKFPTGSRDCQYRRPRRRAGRAGGLVEDKNLRIAHRERGWRKGVHIDLELIDAAIEAAVWEELNKDRERPPEPPSPERFDALTG